MDKVVVATKNKGKLKEFEAFFEPFGFRVVSLYDLDPALEIEETGSTFEENALIKAREISRRFSVNALADDSGLEVHALNGAPGIYSARYSGFDHDDAANNRKLLDALKDVPVESRGAQFVCALAFVTKEQVEVVVRGTTEGVIGFEAVGEHGFGYDPLFYVPRLRKTFAELSTVEKQAISHRGRALEKLKEQLFGEN